jgi:hypothetical protein
MASNLVDIATAGRHSPKSLTEPPNRREVLDRRRHQPKPDMGAWLADLQVLARPASRLDIGEHLVILIGCFPNAKTEDTEIYGRMLAEFVAATNPSLSDLIAARDGLIKGLNFRPSISEVLMYLATERREREELTEQVAWYVANPPKPIPQHRHAALAPTKPIAPIQRSIGKDDDIAF